KKKWSVMVYITASNDLERFGLSDVNEMETVGSSKDVNIVVQLDRIDEKDFHPSQAGSDFIGEGNWSKTRRYYVTKDKNPNKIQSQVLEEIDSVDMGDPKSLSDFAKFSVDKYPAEKYMLVIWNHGAGWPGIAYDDESGNGISMPQLLNSIEDISNHLNETQKGTKLDIVNMDACLMAMLEVGYQLKDHVSFLVGSQELEPGAGMPYGDYLAPLINHPDMSARALSRNMVDKFVKSYTSKGSQASRHWGGSSVTQSAMDLSKVTAVKEKLDQFAEVIMEHEGAWESLILGYNYGIAHTKRYATESFADLYDFMDKVISNSEMSDEIKAAALAVQDSMGVPDRIRRKTDQTVKLVRDEPGYVVWGVNNWKTPASSVWPRGTSLYRSRFAMTPFQKSGDRYVAYFKPFARMNARDTQAPFFANEFNYKFLDANQSKVMIVKEGREDRSSNTIKSNSEYRITQHFKKNSPIVIEGHTQGHDRSYGMSIYLPTNPKKFDMTYKDLKFSQESSWDELVSSTPKFTRKNEVLISDSVVKTFESFQARTVIESVKAAKGSFDLVMDSQIYEGGYRSIFQQYQKDGIIFTGRPGQDLSVDHLKEVLDAGAKVVLYSPSMIKEGIYHEFFQKYLGAEYNSISEDFISNNASRKIVLNDGTSFDMKMADLPSIQVNAGAKSFVQGENGESYGVSFKGKHQLVYLTVPFWSLDADSQTKLMKEVFAQFE
ncbi:clostripain-related cysteine peptidase, partial [bacterium]|nr:clostripain-related cysteine peptidase [bacterium]